MAKNGDAIDRESACEMIQDEREQNAAAEELARERAEFEAQKVEFAKQQEEAKKAAEKEAERQQKAAEKEAERRARAAEREAERQARPSARRRPQKESARSRNTPWPASPRASWDRLAAPPPTRLSAASSARAASTRC